MKVDLNEIKKYAIELGFDSFSHDKNTLRINLNHSIVLVFNNYNETDSLVQFENFGWHTHDEVGFTDGESFIELSYLEFLKGLKTGDIFIVDEIRNGTVEDRYPIHAELNELFKDFDRNSELLIRRA